MGAGATTFEELLLNNTIPNCAAVVRRDLLAGYYADPELRPLERPWPLEDYPMWLWMAPRCTIRFLDCETAVFRVLSDSGSHQSSLDREPSLLFVWRGGGKLVWSALRRSARHEFLNGNR